MRIFTQAELDAARRNSDVTPNGVAYDWWLASIDGAGFCVIREPHHTDADIEAAINHIKNDHDVVGRVRVGKLEEVQPPSLPYPWCFQPTTCAGKGSCPRDPNCGD